MINLNLLIAITILCWGIWGIFDKKALEKASAMDVLVMLYIFYVVQIPVLLVAFNYLMPGWQVSSELVFWTGLAGFCYTAASLAYLKAMEKNEASFVLGITAAYPIVLQFFAFLILGETLVFSRLAGAAMIGLGILAISGSKGAGYQQLSGSAKLRMFACIVVATFGWGIWGIFDKKALGLAAPAEVFFCQCVWDLVWLIVILLASYSRGYRFALSNFHAWKYTGFSALCLTVGAWSYLYCLSASTASYVIVITGCYPMLMYLFALWFLSEKLNRLRLSGIALVVLGGILVQLTQSM